MPEVRGVWFRPGYVDWTGDINAALVMSQIHYWYCPDVKGKERLSHHRKDRYGVVRSWLYKTHTEWWEEVRLTRRQLDRAMDILVRCKLIQVEIFMANSKPTRHILCTFLDAMPLSKRISFAPVGANQCTCEGKPLHLQVHYPTENTTETTADNKTSAGALPAPIGVTDMDAATVLKNKGTPISLEGLWMKRMGTLYGGYQKPLTIKDKAQLKGVYKHLGESTREKVDWVLQNWAVFSWKVSTEKGVSNPPVRPLPGFLLLHVDTLANMDLSSTVVQSIAVPEPVVVKVAGVEDTPAVHDPEKVAAFLEQLKAK